MSCSSKFPFSTGTWWWWWWGSSMLVPGLLWVQVCGRCSRRCWGIQEKPFDNHRGRHHGWWWVYWVRKTNEKEENEEDGKKEKKRVGFSVDFRDGRWCFRHCHAIWKKKPPPKIPQGFKIHEPAPRLKKKATNWQREKMEREEIGVEEASAKVNGKEVLKFDTNFNLFHFPRIKYIFQR